MSEFCLVTKTVPLSDFAQSYLTEALQDDVPVKDATLGGILSNTKYAWYANGPRFQVVDLKKGKTIAAWCFGSIVKDSSTKVVCVAEIATSSRDLPVLVIGLEYILTGGTICIFDVLSSKVLRAIQLREKILSLHVIDGGKSLLPLYGPLRSFDGVVGAGCIGGDVLLIDLCQHSIEEEGDRDEVDACQVVTLTCNDLPNLEYHKQRLQNGIHLAIHLNGFSNQVPNHRGSPDIAISSLFYCPQLGSLLVGYSFGAWQIWELFGMSLVYTSPTYDKNVPVSHFAIQEPADDPKPVCYIWVVYSYKESCSSHPLAVLYSINYGMKEFHDGYGVLYQNFEACTLRYQMELGSLSQRTTEANCLHLAAYNKSTGSKISPIDNHEDVLSICFLAWNVIGVKGVETYISVFDLNQWYKAHMPSCNDEDSENYVSIICVTDLIQNKEFVLDVGLDENSLQQFLGVQKPEEHYFPTALSYELYCCDEENINIIYHQGQQRNLLVNLENAESVILLKPLDICQTALQLGLAPIFFDTSINSITSQREFLLSLALEQQLTRWLCKCADTLSNGRFKSTGCTLDFFLEWAWNRAVVLKANADELSIPLFDYSESIIDANNQKIMNVCISQLANLHIIYEYILQKLEQFILRRDLIHEQCRSLKMVVVHLEVLQWLVNTGLLPEAGHSFLYPIDTLLPYYCKRRSEVQDAYNLRFSSNETVLFIDSLLQNEFSDMTLQEYWKQDEGNDLYPPPSMQSLLRTYLIDDVSLAVKHSVIIYMFLDLAMALDRDKHTFMITQLIKFPVIFQLSSSVIKLTQAFWHLDHGDFGPALERLLDPLIMSSDLKVWHHRTVLNAFLIHGQHNLALTYYQIRKPHLKDDDDVLRVLSLFAENRMIHEAMDFQRKYVTSENQARILTHLYRECNSSKQIKKLLQYALTEKEEQVLMKYLRDISYPHQEELEVMYYLQRFRYMDIFEMSKNQKSLLPSGLGGQKALSFKESFVKTLTGFFPKVSLDLMQACQNQKNSPGNKVFKRPQPMSVLVHNTEEQAKYKSSLIQIGIAKAKETWNKPTVELLSPPNVTVEGLPFVRLPKPLSSTSRKRPSIICPKVIKVNEEEEDMGEAPSKKQRLSPKQSIAMSLARTSFNDSNLNDTSITTKLHTPVVSRKSRRLSGQAVQGDLSLTPCTPQSILKVRNLITSSLLQDDFMPNLLKASSSASTSGLGLTPRKSISRLSVHFEKNPNSSLTESLEQSPCISNLPSILVTDETTKEKVQESSDAKEDLEDVFYSPESSLEEPEDDAVCNVEKSKEVVLEQSKATEDRKLPSPVKHTLQIKGRISYKDKTPDKEEQKSPHITKEAPAMLVQSSPLVSSPKRSKPKGRKSLSRIVLENNALSTLSPTTRRSARRSISSAGNNSLSSVLGDDTRNVPSDSKEKSDMPITVDSVDNKTSGINEKEETKEKSAIERGSKPDYVQVNKSPIFSKRMIKGRRSLSSRSLRRSTEEFKKSTLGTSSITSDCSFSDVSSTAFNCSEHYGSSWIWNSDDSVFRKEVSGSHATVGENKEHILAPQENAGEEDASEVKPGSSKQMSDIYSPIAESTPPANDSSLKTMDISNEYTLSDVSSIATNTSEYYLSSWIWHSDTSSMFNKEDSKRDDNNEEDKKNVPLQETAKDSTPESPENESVFITNKSKEEQTFMTQGSEQKVDAKIKEVNQSAQEAEKSQLPPDEKTTEESKEVFEECITTSRDTVSYYSTNFDEAASLNDFELNIENSKSTEDPLKEPSRNSPKEVLEPFVKQEELNVKSIIDSPQADEILPADKVKSEMQSSNNHSTPVSQEEDSNVMEEAFILSSDDVIEITDTSEESFNNKNSPDKDELNEAIIQSSESDGSSDKSLPAKEINIQAVPCSEGAHEIENKSENDQEQVFVLLTTNESEELLSDLPVEQDKTQQMLDDAPLPIIQEEDTIEVELTEKPVESEFLGDECVTSEIILEEETDIQLLVTSELIQNDDNEPVSEQIFNKDIEDNSNVHKAKNDNIVEQINTPELNKDVEVPDQMSETNLEKTDEDVVELENIKENLSVEGKILRPILTDVLKIRTPTKRTRRSLSVNEITPKVEAEEVKNSGRKLRSVSVDPETPRRKSRRLSGAGVLEETLQTDVNRSILTRRSTKSKSEENVAAVKSAPAQRRITRSASMSDCPSDDSQKEVRTSGRRMKKTDVNITLPVISEEENKEQIRSTRGRSKKNAVEQEETTQKRVSTNPDSQTTGRMTRSTSLRNLKS